MPIRDNLSLFSPPPSMASSKHYRRPRTRLVDPLFLPRKMTNHEISHFSFSPIGHTAPEEASSADVATLHRCFKPLWVAMRILGAFPIDVTAQGVASFKKRSVAFAYTVIVFAGTGTLSSLTAYRTIGMIRNSDGAFNVIIFLCMWLLYCFAFWFLPIGHWFGARKVVDYINEWTLFQTRSHHLTGAPISFGLHGTILFWTLALPVLIVILVVFECTMLGSFENYEAVYFFYIVSVIKFHYFLWHFVCSSLAKASSHLAAMLYKALLAQPCRQDVVPKYQELWEELSYLTCTTGDVLSYSFGYLLATSFAMLTSSIYGAISDNTFNDISSKQIGLTINSLVVFVSLFLLCNSAHVATEQVGSIFLRQLKGMKSGDRVIQHQIMQFRKTVCLEPPHISLGGYVFITRGLLISLMAAIVTYLVVLLQFSENTKSGTDSSQGYNDYNNNSLTSSLPL